MWMKETRSYAAKLVALALNRYNRYLSQLTRKYGMRFSSGHMPIPAQDILG